MIPRDHNNPPEVLELAREVITSISDVMADLPVIQDEEEARAMKLQVDRAKLCVKDLDGERDAKVRPLNNQVDHINTLYRLPRRALDSLLDEMLDRIQLFVSLEKRRREQIATEAIARAREAEQKALEAERVEKEKLDDASKGEIGVDVAAIIADADAAFEDYQRADREAALAARNTRVKVGGGLSRAIGLRNKETLYINDTMAAIVALEEMGLTPDIHEAILKSARAYRKVHGRLPAGVTSTIREEL